MTAWYAAYGSNLLEDRFMTYLRGGPVPLSERIQHGARDATEPAESRPYRIDRTLLFGHEAAGWQGRGVCFLEPDRVAAGDTLGRAWLLTDEQLADVWAQENGQKVGPPIDFSALATMGAADFGSGWYRRLEYLGELEGFPVATFTCETAPKPNASGVDYLRVVGRGLVETWGLSFKEAADYLASRTGNRGHVDSEELSRAIGR